MSGGIERCPRCVLTPLAARVDNLHGTVFLECGTCSFVEHVQRRPDPHPSTFSMVKRASGNMQKRFRTAKPGSFVRGATRPRPLRTEEERRELASKHGRMGGKITAAKRRKNIHVSP